MARASIADFKHDSCVSEHNFGAFRSNDALMPGYGDRGAQLYQPALSTSVALSMIRSWRAPKALTGGRSWARRVGITRHLDERRFAQARKVKMGEP
jgi:hypothetical protein